MERDTLRQLSDAELVIAALVGNLPAFDELARRFRGGMQTVAYQTMGTENGVEDVVQDALLTAFKALPQLDDPRRFGGWLRAITRHRSIEYAKRERRVEPHSDIDLILLEHCKEIVPPHDELLARQEVHYQVAAAVERLPEDHRTVIQLRYWGEMPVKRIADFLDVPLSTVKWRLHEARNILRQRLNGEWHVET
ncbi:MAG: RNA polymerase sigma factor [Candidatus Poribacteria bacterium]|nr:RNA polymerase sigma factor [Candidatus Poribacteria bacterium]